MAAGLSYAEMALSGHPPLSFADATAALSVAFAPSFLPTAQAKAAVAPLEKSLATVSGNTADGDIRFTELGPPCMTDAEGPRTMHTMGMAGGGLSFANDGRILPPFAMTCIQVGRRA